MKTRADLVNEALTRLGANPAGQQPEPEDYAEVDGKVDAVVDDLSQRNIAAVMPSSINDAEFLHVAAVLAYHCRGYFGIVGAEAEGLRNDALLAERQLKFYGRGSTLNKPIKIDYF